MKLTIHLHASGEGSSNAMNGKTHYWKFFRAGGFYQVKLESAADLASLDELDQKLWVALACPTHGLELDCPTLQLIDTDKNGRIRPPELIAAVNWALGLLKNPDDLLKGAPSLPLAAINDATAEGKALVEAARQILAGLGKRDATEITVDDVVATEKQFVTTNFDGDGFIPPGAASDDATKAAITDILSAMGTDVSGIPGLNQANLDAFFVQAEDYSNWWKKIESDKTIMPLGAATAAASVAVNAVAAKVNDFFARCRVAAFDARAVPVLNHQPWDYLPLAQKDLSANAAEFSNFPLAQIAPGKALPLVEGVNPAWAGALADLQNCAVKPLLGDKNSITETDWNSLQSKLAPFGTQTSGGVGASVEKLGLARVRQILAGTFKADITALIAKDAMVAPQANTIRLVRYAHDLYTLCLNFVNFKSFYSRKVPAIFQAGRLYLDQRSCDLCLPVENPAKHALLASLAGAYLAYVECTRQPTGEKRNIVAIVSQGDDGNIMVGRNGIFYDRAGNDYDATITQIISNPISIRQAFWAPYKKLIRFISQQVAKRAAVAEAAAATNMQSTTPAGASAAPAKFDTGTLAAIGLVLSTLMGALTLILSKLFGLPLWEIPLVILGLFFAISLPSVIVAWFKLRARNLGPILDANGWAVNAQAKISVPFGASLTQIATLPPGSQRDLSDPYDERKKYLEILIPLFLILLVGLGIAWWRGALDSKLPPKARSYSILGTNAPDYYEIQTNAVPATNAPPAKASATNAPAAK